jgi:hypothetical protein
MMERIRVPDELRGDLQHAVICTFGANLEFFERDIWRHMTSVNNCVVLADDRQLAEAWGNPEGVDARHVNISYVVAPIRNPWAAHAKLILLTGPTRGRLLVGSGNLSMEGYASQGELFCKYEVSPEDVSALGAFHAVKEFLEGLISRGYIDQIAARHVEQAWADSPWIYSAADGPRQVRHNLDMPFIEQLAEEVGDGPVHELIVSAPFFDEAAGALRQLVDRLNPARLLVLVQPNETSVAPHALAEVLKDHGAAHVRSVEAERQGTYLHAKFILAHLEGRSVCLAGSPNLSTVALSRSDPAGNLELANLHSGDPSSFSHILDALEIGEGDVDIGQAGLKFEPSPPRIAPPASVLLAVLVGDILTVEMSAQPPADATPVLLVAGSEFPDAELLEMDGVGLRFRLDAAMLRGAVPIAIQLRAGDDFVETPNVYPYHEESLRRLLAGKRNPEILRRTSDLDLQDDEIEQLLEELDQVLLANVESVWRVAGKDPRSGGPEEGGETGANLRWDELDWVNLRRHPRLAQYASARTSESYLDPTDLQVILTSIAQHFRREETPSPGKTHVLLDDLEEDLTAGTEPQTEEEREEQEKADERRRLSIETRNRMALRRFATRCIQGLSDEAFLDRVGPAVAVTNAIILNHLLALLVRRGWLDLESAVAFQIDLWRFLWGTESHEGYLASLDQEERDIELAQIREHAADVMTVAGLLWAAIGSEELSIESRRGLRDTTRALLVIPELALTSSLLDAAVAEIEPELPPHVEPRDALRALAEETSEYERLGALAEAAGAGASAHLEHAVVMRGGRQEGVEFVALDGTSDFGQDVARRVFEEWLMIEPNRIYYRIDHPTSRSVAVFDRALNECWWAQKGGGDVADLSAVTPATRPWREVLDTVLPTERQQARSA